MNFLVFCGVHKKLTVVAKLNGTEEKIEFYKNINMTYVLLKLGKSDIKAQTWFRSDDGSWAQVSNNDEFASLYNDTKERSLRIMLFKVGGGSIVEDFDTTGIEKVWNPVIDSCE